MKKLGKCQQLFIVHIVNRRAILLFCLLLFAYWEVGWGVVYFLFGGLVNIFCKTFSTLTLTLIVPTRAFVEKKTAPKPRPSVPCNYHHNGPNHSPDYK